jgi:hypothetical protein
MPRMLEKKPRIPKKDLRGNNGIATMASSPLRTAKLVEKKNFQKLKIHESLFFWPPFLFKCVKKALDFFKSLTLLPKISLKM